MLGKGKQDKPKGNKQEEMNVEINKIENIQYKRLDKSQKPSPTFFYNQLSGAAHTCSPSHFSIHADVPLPNHYQNNYCLRLTVTFMSTFIRHFLLLTQTNLSTAINFIFVSLTLPLASALSWIFFFFLTFLSQILFKFICLCLAIRGRSFSRPKPWPPVLPK